MSGILNICYIYWKSAMLASGAYERRDGRMAQCFVCRFHRIPISLRKSRWDTEDGMGTAMRDTAQVMKVVSLIKIGVALLAADIREIMVGVSLAISKRHN